MRAQTTKILTLLGIALWTPQLMAATNQTFAPPLSSVEKLVTGADGVKQVVSQKTFLSVNMPPQQCPETIDNYQYASWDQRLAKVGWQCSVNADWHYGNLLGNNAYSYKNPKNIGWQGGAFHLADDYFYALAKDAEVNGWNAKQWQYCEQYQKDVNGKDTNLCLKYTDERTLGGDYRNGYATMSHYKHYADNWWGNVADSIMINNLGQCGCVTDLVDGLTDAEANIMKQRAQPGAKMSMDNQNGLSIYPQYGQCLPPVKNVQNSGPVCLSIKDSIKNCTFQMGNSDWSGNGAPKTDHRLCTDGGGLQPHANKLARACVNFWNRAMNNTYAALGWTEDENGIYVELEKEKVPVYEKDEEGKVKKDADGKPIQKRNAKGALEFEPERNANGNIVYEEDAAGNVKRDEDGNPIPKPKMVVKSMDQQSSYVWNQYGGPCDPINGGRVKPPSPCSRFCPELSSSSCNLIGPGVVESDGKLYKVEGGHCVLLDGGANGGPGKIDIVAH